MTTEVFIDLDRHGDRLDDDAEPVGPKRKLDVRVIALGVVAALLLGLPSLSTRPRPLFTQLGLFPRPAMELPRPNSGAGTLRLLGDALIVVAGGAVSALNFDGTQRWSYRSDEPVDYLWVDYAPRQRVFLVAIMDLNMVSRGRQVLAPRSAVALDAATGQPRWRMDGTVRQVGDLVIGHEQTAIGVHHGDPPALRWRADGFVSTAIDAVGKAAWGLTADGTLSEMDLETGVVRRAGKVSSGLGDLFVLRDLVFIVNDETVVALHKSSREPMDWDNEWLPASECGPVLCATSRTSRSLPWMGAVDRATGRLLWQLTNSERWLWPSDSGLLAVRPTGSSGLAPLVGLVDPLTGQLRLSLDGWQVITSGGGGDILLRQEQGRFHLARLTPGGARPLGSVPHVAGSCSSFEDVVMCELDAGRVGVWQLTP